MLDKRLDPAKPTDYVTWMDFQVWNSTDRWPDTQPYCYHRAKNACEGDVDWMQVKVIFRRFLGYTHVRGLCRKHYEQLRAKGVPFVE